MIRILSFLFLLIAVSVTGEGQIFKSLNGRLSFFSSTPAMDIEAISEEANSIINTNNNQLAFSVKNKSFRFKNSLMEEHFNEKYMESSKFPASTFSGTINEKIDFKKDGEYKVSATGKLTIHGITIERTIPGFLIVDKNKISIRSEFMVKTVDHKIEIPRLVFENIAEEIKVTLTSVITVK